jgi:hypothetical protein
MDELEPIIGGGFVEPSAPSQPDPVVARLKTALAATVDGLDPSLIAGETLEEVESSFAALRDFGASRAAAVRIPAGAPARLASTPETPFEKIREGLGKLAG